MRNIKPNNKLNKFYGASEFDLDVNMGMEWVGNDNNFNVYLYSVNRNSGSMQTNIYNEADIDSIQVNDPIELSATIKLNKAENKSYNANSNMQYMQDGDLEVIIYEKELELKGANIVVGDFIGYYVDDTTARYFEVIDDDRINFYNTSTIMGYKRFYKTIKCKYVSPDTFNGI